MTSINMFLRLDWYLQESSNIFRFNNSNTILICWICSKLTIRTRKWHEAAMEYYIDKVVNRRPATSLKQDLLIGLYFCWGLVTSSKQNVHSPARRLLRSIYPNCFEKELISAYSRNLWNEHMKSITPASC